MNTPSPEFIQAYHHLQGVIAEHGENSEQALMHMAKMMTLAPDDVKKFLQAKAKELKLFPQPTAFDDDGQPIFSTAQIARHFGVTENQVIADMRQLEMAGVNITHTGNINLIQ